MLRCAVSVFLGLFLFPLISCSKVNVKKTGKQTYSLKCYYSRSKCDDRVSKICKDEGKISNVLIRRETFENSWVFLPLGFLTNHRPVNHLLVECVEQDPKGAAVVKNEIRESVVDTIESTTPPSKEPAPAFNFLKQAVLP